MGRNKEAPKSSSGEAREESVVRTLAAAAVWLWGLFVLGYFYYSRNFLTLLQQLWEKGSG